MALFNFLSSPNLPLFNSNDLRELVQAFPPRSGAEKGKFVKQFDPEHSFLIPTDNGLIKPQHVREQLRRILGAETRRIPISSLAERVEVDQDVVRSILIHEDGEPGPFWSADSTSAITEIERRKLQHSLSQELRTSIISDENFAKEHNVLRSAVSHLVKSHNLGARESLDEEHDTILQFTLKTEGRHDKTLVYSESFGKQLERGLKDKLEESRRNGTTCILESINDPQGELTRKIIHDGKLASDGRLELEDGRYVFIPDSNLHQQLDTELENLRSGQKSHATLQSLAPYLPTVSNDADSIADVLRQRLGDDIQIQEEHVLSMRWWTGLVENHCKGVEDQGWCRVDIQPPIQLSKGGVEAVTKSLINDVSQALDNRGTTYHTFTAKGETYFLSQQLLDKCLDTVKQLAPRIATDHFETAAERVNEDEVWKDQSFQALPEAVRRDISSRLKGDVKSVYENEMTSLRGSAQSTLNELWLSRISTRSQLHLEAVTAVGEVDSKLGTQLRNALFDYLVLDTLPDFFKQAEKKHAFHASKKVLKESTKLRESLDAYRTSLQGEQEKENSDNTNKTPEPPRDLDSLFETLHTFERKSNIPAPTPADLEARKRGLQTEIATRMQRDGDGPRLFLSLLIVLLAAAVPGVAYATGKMAPRLLKVLKAAGGVAGEEAERLEGWKEEVRKGKAGEETRVQMRAWAQRTTTGDKGD